MGIFLQALFRPHDQARNMLWVCHVFKFIKRLSNYYWNWVRGMLYVVFDGRVDVASSGRCIGGGNGGRDGLLGGYGRLLLGENGLESFFYFLIKKPKKKGNNFAEPQAQSSHFIR
jgi:hypothetical protein